MSTTTANTFATSAPASVSQDTLALIGRVLIALLFVPAGFGKIAGFAGVVGYIGAVGLPLPQLGAVIAIAGGLLAIAALGAGRFSIDKK